MKRVITSEPIRVDEAIEVMRGSPLSNAAVADLISAAREAAEQYTNIYIAPGTVDGEPVGFENCPPSIRQALYLCIVAQHEMQMPSVWQDSFFHLLDPWRVPPCG